jgi:hypothetical protein
MRAFSPCPSQISLGRQVATRAGKTHRPCLQNRKTVTLKCSLVNSCQAQEPVRIRTFDCNLTGTQWMGRYRPQVWNDSHTGKDLHSLLNTLISLAEADNEIG